MKITAFGKSDVGKVRELNEDSFFIEGFAEEKPFGFCVLADGMGGHNAGEVASSMAVDIISREILASEETDNNAEIARFLTAALDFANNEIYNESVTDSSKAGMGTTAVILYITGDIAYIANIGDSRAYILEDGSLRQLTVDHSVVQKLVESGSITAEDARVHPERNIITKALGTEPEENYDIFEIPIKPGDRLLLCSDGLSDMLTDNEIGEILNRNLSDEETGNILISEANEHGGNDNITVLLLTVRED